MRRDIFVLGVFLVFLGLSLMSVSRTTMEPVERWQNVRETEVNPPKESLSVQGNLEAGDEFRVYFLIHLDEEITQAGLDPDTAGVIQMNLTNPHGDTVHLPDTYILMQSGMPYPDELPTGVADATGTFKVDAKSIGWINLESLILQRLVIEGKEPFGFLLPVGLVVSGSGIVLCIFGAKSSKRRKKFRRHEIRRKK